MSRKDALDCWVNTCPPKTIYWNKIDMSSKVGYKGICFECSVSYEIGMTISGGMGVSHGAYAKIQELNK